MPTFQEGTDHTTARDVRWLLSRPQRDALYRRERAKDWALMVAPLGLVASSLLVLATGLQGMGALVAMASVAVSVATLTWKGNAQRVSAYSSSDGVGMVPAVEWPLRPTEQPRPDAIMFCLDETMDMDEELRLRVLRRYTAGHVQVYEYRLPTEKERRESDVQEQ